MDQGQILNAVNDIFKDVLDDEDILLTRKTVADDVEDWDSLTHINIIVAIEKHFNIKFTSLEIQNFKDVGAMCDRISEKLNR